MRMTAAMQAAAMVASIRMTATLPRKEPEPEPEQVEVKPPMKESRQVRRARERLGRKWP